MKANRRWLQSAAAVALAAVACAGPAIAQDWPGKTPIRMIVPYPPAGGTTSSRAYAQRKAGSALGTTIVVDNKGGAAGNLGTDLAAKAPADGYTILFTLSSHTINPKLYPKLPFDVEHDFAAVSLAAMIPQILVAHPSVPVSNGQELIAYAKANPGKLNYASVGIGSPGTSRASCSSCAPGVNMVHVPTRAAVPRFRTRSAGRCSCCSCRCPPHGST
jgi:tripartite-type tricarboxylate transporter receptor subunit TctC